MATSTDEDPPHENDVSAVFSVEAGPSKGFTFTVSRSRQVRIGRDKKCEGNIADNTISRVHGTFEVTDDGKIVYTDSSRNGTWYVENGFTKPTATLKESSSPMNQGDSLLMGHTSVKLIEMRNQDTFSPNLLHKKFLPPSRDLSRVDSFDQEAFNVYQHPLTQLIRRRSIEANNEAQAAAMASAAAATTASSQLETPNSKN